MRNYLMASVGAALMLAGCGTTESSEPVKRQPGSWSTSIKILELEGKDVKPESKGQMQSMFDMMGSMSVCLTKEAVEREDVAKELEKMGTQGGECTFDKKEIKGNKVEFATTCKGPNGSTMKMEATGTNDATTQDIMMTMTSTLADGTPEGKMKMQMSGKRNGECTATDITPPPPPGAAAAEPAKQ